jgi:murein DD-endopeptidase MepM/ murein hydrolase activator NlpD
MFGRNLSLLRFLRRRLASGDDGAGSDRIPTRIIVFGARNHTPREVRVTPRVRRTAAVAAVLVLGVAGHYAWLLISPGAAAVEVLEERDALRQLNRDYAEDTERMASRIESIEMQMRKLAVIAGAEPIPVPIGGVGGAVGTPAGYDYVSDRLEDLSGRIASLDQQSVALERTMREKSKLLASTPSIWPIRGYVSSGFGRRNDPFTGEIERHYGLDLNARTGTPVRVTADGLVVETSTSPTYGKYVVVSHGFGTVTRYAHLSRIDARRGQRLRRGQVLGLVGNTGRSRAPHLHYEVWINERAQDPLNHIVDYTP